MTTQPTPDGPYEVVIPDSVMNQIKDAPPGVLDDLAETIAQMRALGPEAVGRARPLTPHPVDHSPGRAPVYVPTTRSVSYLRNAVADISPPTVETFDDELRQDTHHDSPDDRIKGLREFVLRWVEYIAIHGDHDRARELEDADTPEDFARRFGLLMDDTHQHYFPDARGADLSIRCYSDGRQWVAVCPVTMLRYFRPTEQQARAALRAGLLEMVTGY
jgi:hypothetical protein